MSKSKFVSDFVDKKIKRFSWTGESATRASLAILRRGIGKLPGSIPELWGLVFADLPDELSAKNGEATAAEKAIYTALTLYALHQQSRDAKQSPMNVAGISLGTAIQQLAIARDGKQWSGGSVRRRFIAAASSESAEEFARHLRGLVQLLRAEGIPLDYPALSADLYGFHFPDSHDKIRLNWGREFYKKVKSEKEEDNTEEG